MVKIFATGGTFDKVYFDAKSEFTIGEPQAESILQTANINAAYSVEAIIGKDSLEVTDEDRQMLCERIAMAEEMQVIVIHGTDTMTTTAQMLKGYDLAGKTVVFTGAMQPARMAISDAPFNLGFALAVAQCQSSGVYLAMNGQIFDPDSVVKNREQSRFDPTV